MYPFRLIHTCHLRQVASLLQSIHSIHHDYTSFFYSGYSGYNCTSQIGWCLLRPERHGDSVVASEAGELHKCLRRDRGAQRVETCWDCPCKAALNAKTAKAESYIKIFIKIFIEAWGPWACFTVDLAWFDEQSSGIVFALESQSFHNFGQNTVKLGKLWIYDRLSLGHGLNLVVHVLYIKTCNNRTHASIAAPDASTCSVEKNVYVYTYLHAYIIYHVYIYKYTYFIYCCAHTLTVAVALGMQSCSVPAFEPDLLLPWRSNAPAPSFKHHWQLSLNRYPYVTHSLSNMKWRKAKIRSSACQKASQLWQQPPLVKPQKMSTHFDSFRPVSRVTVSSAEIEET